MDRTAADARIRDLSGLTPPEDFYLLWEFARSLRPDEPELAFRDTADIQMVGPFDLLAGRFDRERAFFDPCLHWRYFGDPVEFVTILLGGCDGLHWGYLVDYPEKPPLGIARYYAHDDVSLYQAESSLFGLLRQEVESSLESLDEEAMMYPGEADEIEKRRVKLKTMLEAMEAFCTRHQVRLVETPDLACLDDWNPPFPFEPLEPREFHKLPGVIEQAMKKLIASGCSAEAARLRLGRILWHWHEDGNPQFEQLAFELLEGCYAAQGKAFFQRVLREHRQHRHRKSLDVFEG